MNAPAAQGLGLVVMERVGRRLLGPTFTLDGIDFGGALDPWIFRERPGGWDTTTRAIFTRNFATPTSPSSRASST